MMQGDRDKQEAAGHLERVIVELENDAWHGQGSERIWAEKVSGNQFRVRNVPFYAYGLGYEDLIEVISDINGGLRFARVGEHSGHSTYRLMLSGDVTDESPVFWKFWQPLQDLGASYEGADKKYLAVDIPPETDIYQAYELLERGADAGIWDFEEGHVGHPLSESQQGET